MSNCSKKWGSVRKVRYLVDIRNSVKFALENKGRVFSQDAFRKYILLGRQQRLEFIHKHYARVRYTPMGRASLATKQLRATLLDTLTFLKNVGIFRIEQSKVFPLPLTFKLEHVSDPNELNLLLIEAILKSKYLAYWCFLWLLNSRKSVEIPKNFARRSRRLRSYLWDQGFHTDVASFYTLRDLFYELEVINWYIGPKGDEHVYPTIDISERGLYDDRWQYSVRIDSSTLFYGRRIPIELFIDALIRSYLKLTRRRYDVEVDLMSLRDDLCSILMISDQHFKRLLRQAQKHSQRVVIRLSYGSVYERKRNYGLKITTLPRVSSDRLALYIRLRSELPW